MPNFKSRFCRIQNLHISQTNKKQSKKEKSFVEFKIYISLKLLQKHFIDNISFVEFKIYISLKPQIEIFDSNFDFYKLIFNCI